MSFIYLFIFILQSDILSKHGQADGTLFLFDWDMRITWIYLGLFVMPSTNMHYLYIDLYVDDMYSWDAYDFENMGFKIYHMVCEALDVHPYT